MCRQCTFNNGTYDFHASLKRLKGRASSGKLKDAGVIEEIFLRNVKIPQKLRNVKLVPCLSSLHTVKRSPAFDRIPVQVKGDGNCLYNAVLCAMFGTERYALQIRLRAAILMATKTK